MKIKMRAVISLTLALVMVLGLAACGNSGGSGTDTGSGSSGDKTDNPAFIYVSDFRELGDTDKGLGAQLFTADGFYASSYEKVGENIPEGATADYEGQYDVYEARLYFVNYDGTIKKLEGYKPLPAPENTENYASFTSNSSLAGIALNADGNLLLIEMVYSSWYDGPEGVASDSEEYWNNFKYVQNYYIRTLSPDGSELSSAQIPVAEGSYLSAYNAQADADGNLLISGDNSLMAIAPDGTTAYTITSDSYIQSFVRLRDGRLGAMTYGDTGMCLMVVDTDAKSLGEQIPLPYDAYNLVSGGGDYDLYYTSGVNFYGYSIETQTSEKLFNWINCDVNSDEMSGVTVSADGQITGVLNHWNSTTEKSTMELVTLTKTPYDSVPHKETLSMAVMYLDYQVRNAVIDFNKKSDKYRIEVIDYSEYNTEDDSSAGLNKLTTEIMAGNVPDILAMNSVLPYAQLASKGLLEDLYPYIEADEKLNKDDFFPTVTSALEVDGKLYEICPSFSINTVIGASSVVGDTPGWSYEQFDEALASMPEGCDPLDKYVTKYDMLQACLSMDMESFVDWTTGECRFDSDGFKAMLEFANRFPESFDWDNYEYNADDNTQTRIAQGKQMLMQASVYSFTDIQYNDIYFGGSSTYIGYPTSSGTGSMISLDSGLSMSSRCANKDAAWQFMRTILTEDYQKNVYSLPTNINAYNAKLKEAMTPQYQTDANGKVVLDAAGAKIVVSHGGMGLADGTSYDFYALTQEQADKLMELINTTTKLADYSSSIFDIVKEQAQAFFAGQKTVDEVAKLIQSKANIFVNEQR